MLISVMGKKSRKGKKRNVNNAVKRRELESNIKGQLSNAFLRSCASKKGNSFISNNGKKVDICNVLAARAFSEKSYFYALLFLNW